MNTPINPSPTGIYKKDSRLHWYAVALVDRNGKPFIIAAKTPRHATTLAKYHTTIDSTKLVAERINIRKGAAPQTQP